MCKRFEMYGKCVYEKTCTFAHGKEDLERHIMQHQAHLDYYYRKQNEQKEQEKI